MHDEAIMPHVRVQGLSRNPWPKSPKLCRGKAKRDAHHASMAERLEYVEKMLGDSADRHSQMLGLSQSSRALYRFLGFGALCVYCRCLRN